MLIVLDTDVLTEIFDRKSDTGEEVLKKIDRHDIATTSINLHEISYGFNKIGKELPEEVRFLEIFGFKAEDALLPAKLESELEKAGNPTGRFYTMIAAICINRNRAIATFNKKHFKKFENFGLKLFDV